METDDHTTPPYLVRGRDRAHIWAHRAEGPGTGVARVMWRALMRYWVRKLQKRVGLS